MSNKYYFKGLDYNREDRNMYFESKINKASRRRDNCICIVFAAFFLVFITMFIPLLGLILVIPAIVAIIGGSLMALKYSKDADKYVKEQKLELVNQLEYYRDSVLQYGIFNVLAMFDEISVAQDERSVLAGIILYFLHKGFLEETSNGYRVIKDPDNKEEIQFLDFLLPDGEDSKAGIKNRMTEAGNSVFEHIEPTLVKDGYLIPYNPNAGYIEHSKPSDPRKKLLKAAENLEEKYKANNSNINTWEDTSNTVKYFKLSDRGEQMANEIMGSYRFFKDFTIIDERSKIDLGLWDDYLVMATIYNMAEKVEIDLEDIMPEWRNFQYE